MGVLENEIQTPAERRAKYWLAKSCGLTPSEARQFRDYRIGYIERRLNLVPVRVHQPRIDKCQEHTSRLPLDFTLRRISQSSAVGRQRG